MFLFLKKNKKIFSKPPISFVQYFETTGTSKLPESKRKITKKKLLVKINSKQKTKMKTKKTPNSPEILKLYRRKKKTRLVKKNFEMKIEKKKSKVKV